jgi:hypothetical protein
MAGEKTVKVKFDGSSKGLAAAAKVAERVTRQWGKQVDKVRKKTESWSSSDNSAKKWAGKAAQAIGSLVSTAQKVGGGIMSAVGSAVSAAGPVVKGALMAVLVAAAAAAAPVIAAAITAGVLLGLSGGVIAGGIALVADSPKVKTAAEKLKHRFLDIDTTDLEANYKAAQERMSTATGKEAKKRAATELREAKSALDQANRYNRQNFSLKDAAKPFVDPLVRALDTLQKSASRVMPMFADMFAKAAPHIDKIAPALVSMAEKALPGIATAVERSGPLFDALAKSLPQLGTYISTFFDAISTGGPESGQLLTDMINIFGVLLISFGQAIGWLTKFYGKAREVWIGVGGVIKSAIAVALTALGMLVTGAAKAFGWIPGVGPKLQAAAAEFNQFKNRANNALAGISNRTVHVDVTLRGIKNLEEQMAVRLGRRASGGPVLAGRSYLVGERGPELLHMGNRSGNVQPNDQVAGAGGDTYVYIGSEELDVRSTRVVRKSERRQAWRAKVGRR